MNSSTKIVQVDDVIRAYGNRRSAELVGTVVKKGRTNIQVHLQVRFSPTGPWFDQAHTVPIHEINVIWRDGDIILDNRPELK